MGTRATFKSTKGGDAEGELREPSGTAKAPGLVLVQEYWGVNDHIKSLAERLAAEGFVVLAPDLYHGKITKNASEASQMMQSLDRERAGAEVAGAVAYMKTHPRSNGKVGIIGFCMGGAFAFTAAAFDVGVSAAVPFYGIPDASKVPLDKISVPVQAHFSRTDPWAKPELAQNVQKQLQARGVPMELHVYDAEHAFMNDTRPEVYSPDSAKLAWGRAVGFLKKHLA